MSSLLKFLGAAALVAAPSVADAAELPEHDPLRILVVGDEVNPHRLAAPDLTQPDDLVAALSGAGNGLNIASVTGVDSQCVDEGLTVLTEGVDVIVYFAHLAALGCDGSPRQTELTAAFESHLMGGGGIVVFHHGIFRADGKEDVLALLGGRADTIAWDEAAGQDVIAVADHFVATQSVEYSGNRTFSGAGVAQGDYPFFNNAPDERYDQTSLIEQGGEDRTIVFTSAGAGGGMARVLGYDLHRSGWGGHVFFYQPGEYQPAALDDVDGNNFQILANAIYYVATTQEDPGSTSGGDEGDESGEEGGEPADGTDGEAGGGTTGDMDATAGEAGTNALPGGDTDDGGSGCSCRTQSAPSGLPWLMFVAGLGFVRRRNGRARAR
ncbi:MAG: hypothetical protein AAF799_46725 [Myxococcota bacterium]